MLERVLERLKTRQSDFKKFRFFRIRNADEFLLSISQSDWRISTLALFSSVLPKLTKICFSRETFCKGFVTANSRPWAVSSDGIVPSELGVLGPFDNFLGSFRDVGFGSIRCSLLLKRTSDKLRLSEVTNEPPDAKDLQVPLEAVGSALKLKRLPQERSPPDLWCPNSRARNP